MKLSVITDEIDSDLERALQVVREFPIDRVELRTFWGTNVACADWEMLQRVKSLLRAYGLGVCSIASPVYKCDLFGTHERGRMHGAPEQPLEEQIQLLRRCIEVAEFFEAPIIRIFAFWRAGELTPERIQAIVEHLGYAVPYAERAGVVLGLENEHACQVGTGAEAAAVLSHFQTPALKLVWDPGNAFCLGESANAGYDAVRDQVVHIHLKDGTRQPDGEVHWVVVGEGEIGYQDHLNHIAQSGYHGYLSLETHAKREGLSQAEVSRLCLQAITQILS